MRKHHSGGLVLAYTTRQKYKNIPYIADILVVRVVPDLDFAQSTIYKYLTDNNYEVLNIISQNGVRKYGDNDPEDNLNMDCSVAHGSRVYIFILRSMTHSRISGISLLKLDKSKQLKSTPIKTILPVPTNDNKNEPWMSKIDRVMAPEKTFQGIGGGILYWVNELMTLGNSGRKKQEHELQDPTIFSIPTLLVVDRVFQINIPTSFSNMIKENDDIWSSPASETFNDDTQDNNFKTAYETMIKSSLSKSSFLKPPLLSGSKIKDCMRTCKAVADELVNDDTVQLFYQKAYTYEGCLLACRNK